MENRKAYNYIKKEVGPEAIKLFPEKFTRAEVLHLMEGYALQEREKVRLSKLDKKIDQLHKILKIIKK
jgi:hypothetical protein